jgi:hypothetical protein
VHVEAARGRRCEINHAISTSVRRVIAVVESANECGDGGDAMGWCRVCELRDALQRQPGAKVTEQCYHVIGMPAPNTCKANTG